MRMFVLVAGAIIFDLSNRHMVRPAGQDPGSRAAGLPLQFEDDVIVTETGRDWISQSIPIEPDDVEKMLQTPTSFANFAGKPLPPFLASVK